MRAVMATERIIALAAKHAADGRMPHSAALALDDARALLTKQDWLGAEYRALDSLAYSVGFFHPEYARACELGDHYR